ncbi:glycine cleavage system aminomethyltransferase GcvT [Orrella marina]|uniref:Aminomethyltransferase n=1 Tax=Orrella marina TaxID=2163011 RepID=A0A2R4XKN0_9BURK|nr:glycine cleavage system aminomethyltransferase GcvT [Orrella marina]AWB34357.1 glycine cleavage system aminomethyltransferase GcvT [Orrella marina]
MSAALKRTPLYEAHKQAQARLVDFGGWEMPVSYGSQIQEHHAVREGVGVFDVSHMLSVDVTGPDARLFLRQLLANDVDRLSVAGRALYSCMLNPRGGVIDDLITYFFSDTDWRLVVNAGCAEKDVAWMRRVIARFSLDVALTPRRDLAMLAVQGPQAKDRLAQIRPEWRSVLDDLKPFSASHQDDLLIARTGYTGEDGFEIAMPGDQIQPFWEALIAADVVPCGLGARDTLRLEAGMALYGQEMDELTLPAEAGLSWTIHLKDESRLFIGRDALGQFAPEARLLGLKLLEKGVMRSYMPVHTEHGAGEITSGTMSPTLGFSIAMARLPLEVKAGDEVRVEIRGKSVAAQVCLLPFVRHGKAVTH